MECFIPTAGRYLGTRHVVECPKQTEGPASNRRPRPSSFEDARLVEQVQAGRTEAYGKLVEKYQDRVFNTCWRISGNLEDARDLTQDAFLRALTRISEFRGQSGFYTWIFRVAVNLALSHRRKAKRHQPVSLDLSDGAVGTQAAALAKRVRDVEGENPSRAVIDSELQGKVVAELQALDDDQRAVIVLRDIEGFDYQEIAEVLDIAIGTVKSRLHRARMVLRTAILPFLGRQ